MRTVVSLLALCLTGLAQPAPSVEIVVPPSAAHPQDWLRPRIRDNPKPDYPGKPAASFAEFVAPEVISKIVVDQYAGPPDEVRRYLAAMPTAAARYFGPSLFLCRAHHDPAGAINTGAQLIWTSTSTVTFASGRRGTLTVATVGVANFVPPADLPSPPVPGLGLPPSCVGADQIPFDSLYVRYVDPDAHSWYFAIPLQRNK